MTVVNKAVKKIEKSMKKKFNKKRKSTDSEESIDLTESLDIYLKKSEMKIKDTKRDNLLNKIDEDIDVHLNEDWGHQLETFRKCSTFKKKLVEVDSSDESSS